MPVDLPSWNPHTSTCNRQLPWGFARGPMSSAPSLARGLLGHKMRGEHRHCIVDQPQVPVAAGVVCQLLAGQPGHQRGPQIEIAVGARYPRALGGSGEEQTTPCVGEPALEMVR